MANEKGKKTDFRSSFSNYTWGCRSGIQKAIRRSEGFLLEETFEELFALDRDFVIRRASVFAGEDVWMLLPETMEVVKQVRECFKKDSGDKARLKGKQLLKGICRKMCAADKGHDAESLASLVSAERHFGDMKGKLDTEIMEVQYHAMKKFYSRIAEGGKEEAKIVWGQLTKAAHKLGAQYAIDMVDAARNRYFWGGMPHEEDKFLACAILALTEYHEMPETNIDTSIEFKPRAKPQIPLYAWDQHTRVGKSAMYRSCNKLGISFGKLAQLWFMMVSSYLSPQRKGEKWFMLERKLTRERVSDKRWIQILDTVTEEIKKKLREEGGGFKP